jgi:hypothetical protein
MVSAALLLISVVGPGVGPTGVQRVVAGVWRVDESGRVYPRPGSKALISQQF